MQLLSYRPQLPLADFVEQLWLSQGAAPAHQMERLLPDGTVENWAFETASPSNLYRRGFRKDTIKPGTVVTIEGFGAKDATHTGNGQRLTMPDGKQYILGTEENPG